MAEYELLNAFTIEGVCETTHWCTYVYRQRSGNSRRFDMSACFRPNAISLGRMDRKTQRYAARRRLCTFISGCLPALMPLHVEKSQNSSSKYRAR